MMPVGRRPSESRDDGLFGLDPRPRLSWPLKPPPRAEVLVGQARKLLTMNNKLYMMKIGGSSMGSPKELTRAEIIRAASNFRWTRKGMKWTVIVGDRELPARPLVLEAAGVPPNDPTNSHQAVEILRRLGFETRYTREHSETEAKEREEASETLQESGSILEMVSAVTREVPEHEWERVPADLSKNVDHYLYGSKKTGK